MQYVPVCGGGFDTMKREGTTEPNWVEITLNFHTKWVGVGVEIGILSSPSCHFTAGTKGKT